MIYADINVLCTGAAGIPGLTGVIGETGPKGEVGQRGPPGLAGFTGAPGAKGAIGLQVSLYFKYIFPEIKERMIDPFMGSITAPAHHIATYAAQMNECLEKVNYQLRGPRIPIVALFVKDNET